MQRELPQNMNPLWKFTKGFTERLKIYHSFGKIHLPPKKYSNSWPLSYAHRLTKTDIFLCWPITAALLWHLAETAARILGQYPSVLAAISYYGMVDTQYRMLQTILSRESSLLKRFLLPFSFFSLDWNPRFAFLRGEAWEEREKRAQNKWVGCWNQRKHTSSKWRNMSKLHVSLKAGQ